MTANQKLHDFAVSHQIGLHRYSSATVRKIIGLLNRVDGDIQEQLISLSPDGVVRQKAKARRLEELIAGVRVVNREAYAVVNKTLRNDLHDLAGYEAEFQVEAIVRAAADEISLGRLSLPKAEDLKAVVDSRPFQGRLLKEWGRDLDENAFKRIRDAIRIGFIEGESTDSIVRRIRGTRALQYKDGILEISRRGAEGLVRTAVAHTSNAAQVETWKANAKYIERLRWTAVLDSRTSPICRARDGETFPVDSGPRPPAHWNCRSIMVPELVGAEPYQGPTYGEWLKRQPASEQDDILGKAKGRLFRSGELPVDRFVDRAGREYTLDELRRREAGAFEKAGIE